MNYTIDMEVSIRPEVHERARPEVQNKAQTEANVQASLASGTESKISVGTGCCFKRNRRRSPSSNNQSTAGTSGNARARRSSLSRFMNAVCKPFTKK
jgi:hypothetical protein